MQRYHGEALRLHDLRLFYGTSIEPGRRHITASESGRPGSHEVVCASSRSPLRAPLLRGTRSAVRIRVSSLQSQALDLRQMARSG
jgi:hypothetical protein